MTEGAVVAALEREVGAPPRLVWALASDTNRWDRLAGFDRVRYEWEPPVGDAPRRRIGVTALLGARVRFVDRGEWFEGVFFVGERWFLDGPLAMGGYRVDVAEAGAGTRLQLRAWATPREGAPAGLGQLVQASMRKALGRYADALERALAAAQAAESSGALDGDGPLGAALIARRALHAAPVDPVLDGRPTAVSEADLSYAARRFVEAPVAPALRDAIVAFVRGRADAEVGRMRPFELARRLGVPRRDALRAFLHAARAGLVDLRWQLNCPTCRMGSEAQTSLTQVRRRTHCDVCDIDYDIDFAANVEAIFTVNRAIRPVTPGFYCDGGPWVRSHVLGVIETPAGGRRELGWSLPREALLVRTLRGRRRAAVPAAAEARGPLVVTVEAGGLDVSPGPAGAPSLAIVNRADEPVTMLLERASADLDAALGVDVVTMPEYMDLFATEAPATGVDLTIGALAVLFSDLTGTTALYEDLGDARAFALVEEHFRAVAALVERHGGSVVKTMGDAVMASFASPERALAAALDMIEATRRTHGAHGLALKVGLHAGPCLAVRANDRLDFFGTVVNVAARLQAEAQASQVVILEDLTDHAGVARLVETRGLRVRRYRAELKGLRSARSVLAIDL